jgi:hypothetical protein
MNITNHKLNSNETLIKTKWTYLQKKINVQTVFELVSVKTACHCA